MKSAANRAIDELIRELDIAKEKYAKEIALYASLLDESHEDVAEYLDDAIADTKSHYGMIAANLVSTNRAQENAISAVEEWVTDNISNCAIETRIANVFAGYDALQVIKELDILVKQTKNIAA